MRDISMIMITAILYDFSTLSELKASHGDNDIVERTPFLEIYRGAEHVSLQPPQSLDM